LGRSTTLTLNEVQEIARGERLSPAQALKRLETLATARVDEMVEALRSGEPDALSRFQQLAVRHQISALASVSTSLQRDPSTYPPEAQKRVLQAIAGVPFNELNLSAFATVLNDALLRPILKGAQAHLWSLDLSGCWRLTQDSLVSIAEFCPTLEKLVLRNLNPPQSSSKPPLTEISKPFLSVGILTFAQLRDLNLEDCHLVRQLVIQALYFPQKNRHGNLRIF
jgi:hypothetical protein